MNYLTDSEIIDWNNININNKINNYYVSPMYNNNNGYPCLKFDLVNKFYETNEDILNDIDIDPVISYDIFFSILESGKDIFLKIKNSIFSIDLKNKVYSKNKYTMIDISSLMINENEDLISFKGRKYINLKISLEGKTSAIIAYYSLIKRSIKFYEKSWGILQKEEMLLLPFKIGDIVTPIDNMIDMVIIDFYYDFYYDVVKYVSKEIIDNTSYILYGEKNTYLGEKIVLSRNNKLEILLED